MGGEEGWHLGSEAGTCKLGGDPGLHNEPLGCGASEVYASGPACEEEEEEEDILTITDMNITSLAVL